MSTTMLIDRVRLIISFLPQRVCGQTRLGKDAPGNGHAHLYTVVTWMR